MTSTPIKAVASHNGMAAAGKAYALLTDGGSPLDACVAGVTLVEDDPEDMTVGYGGLPNEDGVVELDAAVMEGLTHRAGAVVGLRNVRHAAQVARCLLRQTNRVMLAGEGALKFARAQGFPEEDLLTDRARRMWLYWKRQQASGDDWVPPAQDFELDVQHWFTHHFYKAGGTVHCSALSAQSDLACATTTSGHPFKLTGRVGDSPIPGAGMYVDNDVGSCGSIGHGEATMQTSASFLVVELMRTGMSPLDAGLEAIRRIVHKTPPELRAANGRPKFDVQLFVLAKDGRHAGVAMYGDREIAVSDQHGTRREACVGLYARDPDTPS